jgi:hypothetical protein
MFDRQPRSGPPRTLAPKRLSCYDLASQAVFPKRLAGFSPSGFERCGDYVASALNGVE